MKTTIEIADDLFLRAKLLTEREQVTLRSLTEEGLRHVLESRAKRAQVKLKPVTVKGNGIRPELRDAPWSHVRALIYGGRE